jgi:hypothetical protein
VHDRPTNWAVNPERWPDDLRPVLLPQNTLSHRLRRPRTVELMTAVEQHLLALIVVGGGFVQIIDGKALPVSGVSKDRGVGYGRRAGGKGHRYLTVVLDLETGAVVHVGHGKGGDALTNFWKRLRRCGAKIEAVATDISPAYIEAVMTHLPEAVLVFDRFHVMKVFNDKLSDLRRDLYRAAKDGLEKDVLKGTRWLLLKRPENLDASRNEHERLEQALRSNAPLATAYYLKEDLGEFWEQDDPDESEAFLLDWIRRAESTKFACSTNSPQRFVSTLTVSLRITITSSPPALWKAPTTRSRP